MRGFTLVELLVVVLIIGILAAIALPQYKKAVTKARFSEAISNLKTIYQADRVCHLSGKNYCKINELDIAIPGTERNDTCGWPAIETEHFYYWASDNCGSPDIVAALYKDEDVCICIDNADPKIIVEQGDSCRPKEPSYNYSKLLNLESGTCACC